MRDAIPALPWYRQAWPWLLMLMPALAVVGGAITFWLASTTNNAMVVDDYYREGKAINLQLARDRTATELGLSGRLEAGAGGAPVLKLRAAAPGVLPATVDVRLVHATRAELDRKLVLRGDGTGTYTSADAGALPASGRWNVHVEDPDRHWRLLGVATGFEQPLLFESAPR
jgi:hypothetical protein